MKEASGVGIRRLPGFGRRLVGQDSVQVRASMSLATASSVSNCSPSRAASAYRGLALNYFHAAVDHVNKYVVGRVHTNGLENFWSLLKRSLKGTYVAVAPFHLERYVDEQAFRYNQRKVDDASRFRRVLASVLGKRLTWRELTAQNDAGFMGIK